MRFVEVKEKRSGSLVTVNIDHILSVQPTAEGSALLKFVGGYKDLELKDTYSDFVYTLQCGRYS